MKRPVQGGMEEEFPTAMLDSSDSGYVDNDDNIYDSGVGYETTVIPAVEMGKVPIKVQPIMYDDSYTEDERTWVPKDKLDEYYNDINKIANKDTKGYVAGAVVIAIVFMSIGFIGGRVTAKPKEVVPVVQQSGGTANETVGKSESPDGGDVKELDTTENPDVSKKASEAPSVKQKVEKPPIKNPVEPPVQKPVEKVKDKEKVTNEETEQLALSKEEKVKQKEEILKALKEIIEEKASKPEPSSADGSTGEKEEESGIIDKIVGFFKGLL